MFGNQPKIDIKPNEFDRKLILVGWILVALNFILALSFYSGLPDTIPTHFNLKGEADGFGNKSTLWLVPFFNLITYFGMTMLATKMKPWNYNYPTKVTEKNAPKLYAMSIRMLVWLNLGIAFIFLVISLNSILLAKEVTNFSIGWLIIVLVAVITIRPFVSIFKMFKVPKS
ncbi:hypothetical protein MTsPCn9_27870 [Croceitalea sp. MTPC9]|uniref:DUF1648 domain-containing protein n=1 Tax=unclassified Croceitalea TaxID=2632280 RepID=UPI002B381925|nr:hypothetical protein MTsPCn6_22310 [Croceitalea sp. MTPC6]GMN17849.1 hypothetical protein MTsPCn9_27870 [Croceitalea sp. MTPC9]